MRTFAQKPKATQQTTSAKSTIPGRTHLGQSHEVNSILHLQRTIGNQAVQRLLEANTRDVKGDSTTTEIARFGQDFSRIPIHSPRQSPVQPERPPRSESSSPVAAKAERLRDEELFSPLTRESGSWDFSRIPAFAPNRPGQPKTPSPLIQPKLVIGQVNDPLEHEADRIADQVMLIRGPDLSVAAAPSHVSRKCAVCEEEDAKTLQTTQPDTREVDGRVASEIRALQGSGSPLPKPPRAFFESRFGHDFTAVRIHSDSRSARLARSVNARAFTLGQDIVFGPGEYSPETGEGTRLLAHELAHVVQQQKSQATIQRQPAKGGGSRPFFSPAIDEAYDQLDIIREGQLPLEFYRRPEIRALSFGERQDMEFQRKLKAIYRLGDLRDQRAVLTLVAVLEDKIFPIQSYSPAQKLLLQQAAAESLGKIGGKVALSKLSDLLLKSKDPKERMMAARGLPGAAGGQAATDLLTALKTETDADLKAQIIFALGNAGRDLGNMQEKQSIATELIRQMENNKDAVHLAAINALGKLRLKSATEPLLKQLTKWHSVELLAADIVSALGEIGDERAVDLVVVMLEIHVKKRVRSEAALALGKIGGSKARAALKRRLNQETEDSVKADILKAMTPVIHWTFRSARSLP
jgi:HEAT repeat protein